MARALAGSASARRFAELLRKQRDAQSLTGHIRLLAQPAYQRLLTAEPFFRRAIPPVAGRRVMSLVLVFGIVIIPSTWRCICLVCLTSVFL